MRIAPAAGVAGSLQRRSRESAVGEGRPGDAPPRVLVADDDPIVAESLAEFLHTEGYEAITVFDGEEALEALGEAEGRRAGGGPPTSPARPIAAVICDMSMPRLDGLETLRRIGKEFPTVAVIVLTGYATIDSAVEAVRLGAVDYLTKPVVDKEVRLALQRAMRQHTILAENHALRSQLDERFGLESIVGSDHRMLKTFDLIQSVAPSKTTVLMTGESGVGKSLVAHAIHRLSPRRDKPFVELACGSIPETLLESELFGHVKGAFTGAHADKPGKFLAADGGTIFLDEINSASPGMQLKLLRVLQERRFEPVGSNQTIEVDVRVVIASNQPLEALVAQGKFRQDLYYRINVVKIELPPLRERTSDIALLASHFLSKHSVELGKQIVGFSAEAAAALLRYSYPGNVRELQNIIERAAVLTRSATISIDDLPEQVVQNASALRPPREASAAAGGPGEGAWAEESAGHGVASPAGAEGPTQAPATGRSLEESLRDAEREILVGALREHGWNRQQTADALRINRTTLYKKMKTLGIGEHH
ncbi:MAG: sigma-54-dependent transcriptional regulator [Phycisphaerales bacterium]